MSDVKSKVSSIRSVVPSIEHIRPHCTLSHELTADLNDSRISMSSLVGISELYTAPMLTEFRQ